ncbi:MAG: hypothetical protein H8E31_06995 [Planctomycetes bacterium]|nr:hypothetical protein [Planctomycetota bacterium]
MWVIALCVILVFIALFAFTSQQSAADWNESQVQALADRDTALAKEEAARKSHADLSQGVGFIQGSEGYSVLNALKAELGAAASVFGVPDANRVETLLPAATTAYQKVLVEKRDLESTVAQLRNDLQARNTAHQAAIRDKDGRISELSRSLEDTTTSLNNRNIDLERQRDSLRQQVSDYDSQVSILNTRIQDQERAHLADREVRQQTNQILATKLNKVERRTDTADGTVLTASASLKKAWIDRGRLDRIVPGMEFAVHNAANMARKGRIKVVNVEDKRAECVITDAGNRFDPIGEDDLILNAMYDPSRQPVAVLLGNGFGSFSQTDIKNKLKEVGILVADKVSNEADYLVLGTPFFDEETGEVIDWASRDEYRQAVENSLTIVPLRDAMAWLGL